MKSYISLFAMMLVIVFASCLNKTYAQSQEPVDLNQLAEEEADRLQRLLDLEDWQTFYVDSTLKANYVILQKDLENLHKSKVSNISLFQEVRDKCWDNVDAAYKKYFTEEQWAAYLKSGAARAQKQRAKRRAQMNK